MAEATYVTSAIGPPTTVANAKQLTNSVRAVHARFAPVLAGYRSPLFPLDSGTLKFADSADESNEPSDAQLQKAAILEDTGRVA
jgi:hypothetical protein